MIGRGAATAAGKGGGTIASRDRLSAFIGAGRAAGRENGEARRRQMAPETASHGQASDGQARTMTLVVAMRRSVGRNNGRLVDSLRDFKTKLALIRTPGFLRQPCDAALAQLVERLIRNE